MQSLSFMYIFCMLVELLNANKGILGRGMPWYKKKQSVRFRDALYQNLDPQVSAL